MISDLYVKPYSERGSASRTRRVMSRGENNSSRRSLNGPSYASQTPIFERLYKEALNMQ